MPNSNGLVSGSQLKERATIFIHIAKSALLYLNHKLGKCTKDLPFLLYKKKIVIDIPPKSHVVPPDKKKIKKKCSFYSYTEAKSHVHKVKNGIDQTIKAGLFILHILFIPPTLP